MAKQRVVNTRFWSDPWVVEKLNPLDRYLFLYLLTNEHTNLSGIYELSLRTIATETGLDSEALNRVMFPRLAPKVYFEDSWVVLINFAKHQNLDNPSIVLGIQRELGLIPEHIRDYAVSKGYPVPKKGGSTPQEGPLNLTKLNLSDTADAGYEVVLDAEKPPKEKEGTKRYDELISWLRDLTGAPIPNKLKQYAHLKRAKAAGIDPSRLKARAEELWAQPFFQENGMDWGNVLTSFDRKA